MFIMTEQENISSKESDLIAFDRNAMAELINQRMKIRQNAKIGDSLWDLKKINKSRDVKKFEKIDREQNDLIAMSSKTGIDNTAALDQLDDKKLDLLHKKPKLSKKLSARHNAENNIADVKKQLVRATLDKRRSVIDKLVENYDWRAADANAQTIKNEIFTLFDHDLYRQAKNYENIGGTEKEKLLMELSHRMAKARQLDSTWAFSFEDLSKQTGYSAMYYWNDSYNFGGTKNYTDGNLAVIDAAHETNHRYQKFKKASLSVTMTDLSRKNYIPKKLDPDYYRRNPLELESYAVNSLLSDTNFLKELAESRGWE
ncbi:MAG: hypothetical protein LBK26_00480 [Rickettsiales bacterium]|jgi:hypothetical protein|nr:hypothetical protein [Rickettsiales bacterium]